MSEPPAFDAARHVAAMAPTLGLAIPPEREAAVRQFLEVAERMAALVRTAPLGDGACELAPVFRPGPAGGGGGR